MTVSTAEITDGIYSRLTGDSTFNTAIGGGATTAGRLHYAIAPRDPTTPFVTYNVIGGAPIRTMADDGYELRVQFSVYGGRAAGPRAVQAVMDLLRARLDVVRFTIANHANLPALEQMPRGPMLDGDTDDALWVMYTDYLITCYDS